MNTKEQMIDFQQRMLKLEIEISKMKIELYDLMIANAIEKLNANDFTT